MANDTSLPRDPESTATASGTKRASVKTIVALVLLALALVFAFSNLAPGPVNFLAWTITMPTWIWFLVVLVVGVIVGSLFPWFRPRRRR